MPREFNPDPIIEAMHRSSEAELQEMHALRDENDSLRQECQELRAENKELKSVIDRIMVITAEQS